MADVGGQTREARDQLTSGADGLPVSIGERFGPTAAPGLLIARVIGPPEMAAEAGGNAVKMHDGVLIVPP